MKTFRTELRESPSRAEIALGSSFVAAGSCFAASIGERLARNKFKVLVNPLGTLYHPLSIHKSLLYSSHQELPMDSTYVENQGVWSNYEFHSSLSSTSKNETEKRIRESVGLSHHFLKDADVLLITYGTARVHYRVDTGEPVANCHKVPSTFFTARILSADEIADSFRPLYSLLRERKPSLRIILTVSPVRHLRDTLELNSFSKANLRVACQRLSEDLDGVEYFPAFEIMMDDLRDYRFYEPDMIHPSDEAITYIWEKFAGTYFGEQTRSILRKWQSVLSALEHRPFHQGTAAHRQFLQETLRRLQELKSFLNVDEEIQHFSQQLMSAHV